MNAQLTIGSLCSGFGGLDLAVEKFFGARTVWFSEFDPAPSKILAHHWPDVLNLGDMTKIDWSTVEPADIVAGGTPCQDLSGAGKRAGMTEGTRSNLWVQMRECIAAVKPSLVIWENVRGAYSACADSDMGRCPGCVAGTGEHRPFLRALGRVLGDLSDLGFDAEVVGLRASDAGAPHARFRVFVVAYSRRLLGGQGRLTAPGEALSGRSSADIGRSGGARVTEALKLLPTPDASVANDGESVETWEARRERVKLTAANGNGMGTPLSIAAQLFPTPRASDGEKGGPNQRGSKGDLTMNSAVQLLPTPTTQDASNNGGPSQFDRNTLPLNTEVALFPTPRMHDFQATMGSPGAARHVEAGNGSLAEVIGHDLLPRHEVSSIDEYKTLWDSLEDQSPFWVTDKGVDYWPAISRWSEVMGRKAPSPTIPDGKNGRHRLNPWFAEWLMGADEGWICSPDIGLTRNQQLKACGNGVVTQQAELALSIAWPWVLDCIEIERAA